MYGIFYFSFIHVLKDNFVQATENLKNIRNIRLEIRECLDELLIIVDIIILILNILVIVAEELMIEYSE